MTRGIYDEYHPKPVKVSKEVAVEDTKKTEKFEPIYDDEGNLKDNDKEVVESYVDPLQRRANNNIVYSYN